MNLRRENLLNYHLVVIDQRRILEIKRQLKGTNKSGKTIAYKLNFGEPTHF